MVVDAFMNELAVATDLKNVKNLNNCIQNFIGKRMFNRFLVDLIAF